MELARTTTATKTQNRVSQKEYELIRELSQIRKEEQGQNIDFENLNEYELPPRTQFSMLKKPAVSLKGRQMTFNMACIRLFEGIQFIVPLLNKQKKRLAIILCAEEEISSIEWCRQNKDNVWVNKAVTSEDFLTTVFGIMSWNTESRYKALGRIANSERGLILVFDLIDAIEYTKEFQEYVDPKTGDTKKRQVKQYSDYYKEHIGKPYSDYEAARQSSLFEDVVSYDSTDGQFPGDGSEPPGTISVAAAGPPNGELMEGSNNGT